MEINPFFMERALEIAALGGRAVMPNPLVGAVIVHKGEIIGEGYHARYGGPHAEVHALDSVKDRSLLKDATMYVSLEPCAHFGKTPPCADLVANSGIRRVVVGCLDPNPKVGGKGIQKLRDAGIEVHERVRERECVLLNRRFMTYQILKRPYIILKWAETADHFIARADGSSKWISSEFSRRTTHRWRAQEMSILVGTRTALLDNPRLTVRHVEGANPLRIVIDRSLSLPETLHLFDQEVPTWIFNDKLSKTSGTLSWKQLSGEVSIPQQVCDALASEKIISLFIEGGAHTIQSFIDADLWDEARVFQSPRIFTAGIPSPTLGVPRITAMPSGKDRIEVFQHPHLASRLGIRDSSPLTIEDDLVE
jgi:diaminohydroxyphosphoribosylaminopyrimidine deaminase/5-amino-6-(5-phosphoribosylamino)uracil reductase